MTSRRITHARVALAAGLALITALVARAARADEDSRKAEAAEVRAAMVDAQPEGAANASGDEGGARLTREELRQVQDAIQRLEREKADVQRAAPDPTAGEG